MRRPKAIDLFSGPGGLSLGVTHAGFDVVGAVEWNKAASNTYAYNLGDHVYQHDIQEFSPQKMEDILVQKGSIRSTKEIELICGGPPCPAFSLMGRSKISNLIKTGKWKGSDHRHAFIDDPRVGLFLNFVRYVKHFTPRFFIMENVSGMNSFKEESKGKVRPIVDVIKSEFTNIGYSVKSSTLNASDYGVPQNRRRVIFLGWKTGDAEPNFPAKKDFIISSRDSIYDLPKISPVDGKSMLGKQKRLPKAGSVSRDYVRWCRQTRVPSGRKDGPLLHHTRAVNPRDKAIFPNLRSGEKSQRVLYKDISMEMVKKHLPDGYHLREFRTVPNRVEGPRWGRQKRAKWKFYDQKKFGDKMRRIRGDLPSPTIVAHLAKDGYMFVHPDENRTISVREAARFQSFPDSFDFSAGGQNSITDQFRQIGNAVPPIFAQAIAEEIMKIFD